MKIIDFSMKINDPANEEEEEKKEEEEEEAEAEEEEEEEEEDGRKDGASRKNEMGSSHVSLAHHPSACSFQGIRHQFELLSAQAALDASIRGRLALHPSHHLCTCKAEVRHLLSQRGGIGSFKLHIFSRPCSC